MAMLVPPAEAGKHARAMEGKSSDDRLVPARAGVVVGRNVGGAVVRSRVKRRLREVLRARLEELPDGSLTVIRALPGADVPYTQIETWVGSALRALDPGTGCSGHTRAAAALVSPRVSRRSKATAR